LFARKINKNLWKTCLFSRFFFVFAFFLVLNHLFIIICFFMHFSFRNAKFVVPLQAKTQKCWQDVLFCLCV